MAASWIKILTDPKDGEYLVRQDNWTEIMVGNAMGDWIETQAAESWICPYPGIYWIDPELYLLWKLKYA